MFSPRITRRLVTLLLLLYVALPVAQYSACSGHHTEHGMADCLAQCQLCSSPAMAPGFSEPSAPVTHDLTGPRTAIIAANHDGESHLPQQARAPPATV